MAFYSANIDSFRPGIPIYIRWGRENASYAPVFLRDNQIIDRPANPPFISVDSVQCFEHVYIRRCMKCFYYSISVDTVMAFKSRSYAMTNHHYRPQPSLTTYFPYHGSLEGGNNSNPIIITVAYRDREGSSRQLQNIDGLVSYLAYQLPTPYFSVRTFLSTDERHSSYHQISTAASSHVMISEHGAFQSNLIYMRNSSLMIELNGNYSRYQAESHNYRILADMFGVFYENVMLRNFTEHRQRHIEIHPEEMAQTVDIIRRYALEQPYRRYNGRIESLSSDSSSNKPSTRTFLRNGLWKGLWTMFQ